MFDVHLSLYHYWVTRGLFSRVIKSIGRLIMFFIKWLKKITFLVFIVGFCFTCFSSALVLIMRWGEIPVTGIKIERGITGNSNASIRAREMEWKRFNELSEYMPLAVIASEDQNFFNHNGFDFKQIKKAIAESKKGKRLRGASTISQQTVKNVFLWSGRSFIRKGLEVWFTLLIELFWSKERILEVYLNVIEFGTGVYGVEAASAHYFGKSSKYLNVDEAVKLAVVLPNPHKYSVLSPSEYILDRQAWVRIQMEQLGSIEYLQEVAR